MHLFLLLFIHFSIAFQFLKCWLLHYPGFDLTVVSSLRNSVVLCQLNIEEVWWGGQFVLYGWVWVFVFVPVKILPFIFWLANREMPSRDAIGSTQTEKYRSFPPPWSLQDAASWQGCGNKRPGCMTHSFIKKMAAVCHRSVRARDQKEGSSAKLLFIPVEYTMTRLWQKSSLQMTK